MVLPMSKSSTLLIEIGTEDLPADLVNNYPLFRNDCHKRLVHEQFLQHDDNQQLLLLYTPRRIAVKIKNVATYQPQKTEERKGPPATRINATDPATSGFAKSCGVAISDLEIRDGRLFCHAETGGKSLKETLPTLLPTMLNQLKISRPMRWGSGEHLFARPVHWLCVLHGSEVIPCELFGIKADRLTYGHHYHCPKPLQLENADDYEKVLKKEGQVIVDFDERAKILENSIQQYIKTSSHGLHAETAATTEWPQVLTAKFDQTFLSLPHEVITQTLEQDLKVFPQKDTNNQLLPKFVIVADIEYSTPQTTVRGYENVARARLEDAKFFFVQDKKTTLENRRAILKRTQFQEKLGTLADKTIRLEKLTKFLAQHFKASSELAQRAAQLCKCDLGTDIVGEYPQLQGIMGGYYARADGEPDTVADAIRDHYRYELPSSPEGVVLALADRLDTLAGFWRIGLIPKSSKDPYGLRRAINGMLRILIESKVNMPIQTLVDQATAGYHNLFDEYPIKIKNNLCGYIYDQLRSTSFIWRLPICPEISTDIIDAVDNVSSPTSTSPFDFIHRLKAIDAFIKNDKLNIAKSLIQANKRIANILKNVDASSDDPKADIMTEDAECKLLESVNTHSETFNKHFDNAKYDNAMKTLEKLRAPIDHFFDEILVMSDDETQRNNRLALLNKTRNMFLKIADFSKLNSRTTSNDIASRDNKKPQGEK